MERNLLNMKSVINVILKKVHQRLHYNEKPIKCDQCDKYFSHKIVILRHQSIHSGERPF